MASHFEDSCKMETFEPHRPSSFFEVFYPVSTGNFLRRARRVSAACAYLFVWGWCPWRCQSTCLRCLSASVAHVLFFCYLQLFFFCKFCCWPRFSRRGRSEAWICLICPRLPVLGWPSFMVAFFVLTSRRLTCLWRRLSTSRDEFCRVTHDALVAFVGEAAL